MLIASCHTYHLKTLVLYCTEGTGVAPSTGVFKMANPMKTDNFVARKPPKQFSSFSVPVL